MLHQYRSEPNTHSMRSTLTVDDEDDLFSSDDDKEGHDEEEDHNSGKLGKLKQSCSLHLLSTSSYFRRRQYGLKKKIKIGLYEVTQTIADNFHLGEKRWREIRYYRSHEGWEMRAF